MVLRLGGLGEIISPQKNKKMNKQYAVIGNPVLHSLSPLIHQRAFDYYNIEARYFAYEVADFTAFMHYFHTGGNATENNLFTPHSYLGSRSDLYQKNQSLIPYTANDFSFPLQGLSITIPHKKNVLEIADRVSYKAKLAGAANTLYWHEGKLVAENTDIAGFYAPLEKYLQDNPAFHSAIIYGAGGAACAVLTALLHIQDLQTICLCARREEQAQELISHIKNNAALLTEHGLNTKAEIRYLPLIHEEFPCDLVVNTIPQWSADAKSPRENFADVRFAYDLTYKQTPFLAQAQTFANCHCKDGKTMFIEQAKAQFSLWTGLQIPEKCYQNIF